MQVRGFAFRSNPQQVINIHRRFSREARFASQVLPMMNRIVTIPKMT